MEVDPVCSHDFLVSLAAEQILVHVEPTSGGKIVHITNWEAYPWNRHDLTSSVAFFVVVSFSKLELCFYRHVMDSTRTIAFGDTTAGSRDTERRCLQLCHYMPGNADSLGSIWHVLLPFWTKRYWRVLLLITFLSFSKLNLIVTVVDNIWEQRRPWPYPRRYLVVVIGGFGKTFLSSDAPTFFVFHFRLDCCF